MFTSLYQAISKRKSVRDFNSTAISQSIIDELESFIQEIPSLTPSKTGIKIFKNTQEILTTSLLTPLGSFISNAPYFAAISSEDHPQAMIEAGYQSEHLILKLTELHLGTCYIGGFLNFAYLEKKLRIPNKEKLLVIIPFGNLSNTFTGLLTNSIIETGKFFMGESGRKPLNEIVYYESWGTGGDEYLQQNPVLKSIFENTRLAPSGANLQPWRFLITPSKIYAFCISTLKGKIVGNENLWGKDYRYFDLGIALSHFALSAQALKFNGKWHVKSEISKSESEKLKIPSTATFVAQWELL